MRRGRSNEREGRGGGHTVEDEGKVILDCISSLPLAEARRGGINTCMQYATSEQKEGREIKGGDKRRKVGKIVLCPVRWVFGTCVVPNMGPTASGEVLRTTCMRWGDRY